MKNLVGKVFSLAQGRYRIVDVQRLSGDAMVYAERMEGASAAGAAAVALSPRAAFRYADIAVYLDAPNVPG